MNRLHGSTLRRKDGLVVFYENKNTYETRHCFVPHDMSILSFHDGFTLQDREQGWTVVLGMSAGEMTDMDIEVEHGRLRHRRAA